MQCVRAVQVHPNPKCSADVNGSDDIEKGWEAKASTYKAHTSMEKIQTRHDLGVCVCVGEGRDEGEAEKV